ncbi:MAG: 1,4-alpha-glucan branching protein GlgB [Clostridia bacterium]|nr:1,4-alpha-glucan branching protein GlgB [Clostridia bacterium]
MNKQENLAGYLFHEGTNFASYKYLGCTLKIVRDKYHYTFRTWAPNARAVGLISDFSGWDAPIYMSRVTPGGVWELLYISDISLEKQPYKLWIETEDGRVLKKGDPYARFSRGLADGASLIFTRSDFTWSDAAWFRHRAAVVREKNGAFIPYPINIYEVHAGSFMRHEDGRPLSYRELADTLVPYLRAMGYTHIELLPLMEHPFDASWGYQVCGFYAPTSRFGDPDDLRYFINEMHRGGIGVILDWVPAHFPRDEWGLFEFDGRPLYEYQGKDRQESRSWGTRFFDLGREEIQCFLVSSALYYLREFHVDGLRVDAVASMLYLDYDRDAGEWIPAPDGSNINPEAVAFFKKLNTAVLSEYPDVLMIAEESGSHGGITRSVSEGGLGFNMKWNMGFANDLYRYLSLDPIYRAGEHKALNFPIMYAFTEKYCLPISHDEVVHGKRSFIDKMFGSYEDKFSEARAAMLFIMTFPGKKLTFMGTEYAQFREWDYASSLEWFMLDYPMHRAFRDYVRELNMLYLSRRELHELDFDSRGFSWLLPDEAKKNSVAYRRIDTDGNSVIVVVNFSGSEQTLSLSLPRSNRLEALFMTSPGALPDSVAVERAPGGYRADVKIPSFSGAVYKEKIGKKTIKL